MTGGQQAERPESWKDKVTSNTAGLDAHATRRVGVKERKPLPGRPIGSSARSDRLASRKANPGPSVLYGRRGELARLEEVIRHIKGGRAQTLLIEGEPGIGKSSFVRAACRSLAAQGIKISLAVADELGGRRPLSVVAELLGDERLQAPHLWTDAVRTADATFRTSDQAIDVVEALCSHGPLALIVEDLHWADAASLFVLRRLRRHSSALPVALIGTMRPLPRSYELAGMVRDAGARSLLALGPLDDASLRRVMADRLGGTPGPGILARMASAGGNPLFASEIAEALVVEGALTHGPGDVVDVIGDVSLRSLSRTVLDRLSFLSPDTAQVLAVAAVLGVRFHAAMLASLTGRKPAELVRPLREALRAGVLEEDGDLLSFRHELIRTSLYEDAPLSVRTSLHHDAARLLADAGAPAGDWAEHLLRGSHTRDEATLADLRKAARDLMDTLPHAAVELLDRALDLAPPAAAERADIIRERALALLSAGRTKEGEACFRLAMGLVSDGRSRAGLMRALCQSLLDGGDVRGVLRETEAGLAEAGLPDDGRALLYALRAMALHFVGDFAKGREAGDAAEALGPITDPSLRVFLDVTRSLLAASEGWHDEALTHVRSAVAAAKASPSVFTYAPVPHVTEAMVLLDLDRFAEAESVITQGREIQEHFGHREKLVVHHMALSYGFFWRGEWDAAEAEIETGLRLAEEVGAGWLSAARGLRAVIAASRGDLSMSGRWLRQAQAGLAKGEAPYRSEWLWWSRALWQEMSEPLTPAGELMRTVLGGRELARISATCLPTVGPFLTRVAVAAGKTDLAQEVIARLQALADAAPHAVGIRESAQVAWAIAAGDSERLAGAAGRIRQTGRLPEAGFALEEAAVAASTSRRHQLAEQLAASALEVYGSLEAVGLAQRMARRLRASGSRIGAAPLRPRSRLGWTALTPTEMEVLRLVVARRSNPEIARFLTISRRTVETHVSHILSKVAVTSRLELIEAASRHFGWQVTLQGGPPGGM